MNDKQQLAAMGEHLAEQQPMCMAKRIEELEAAGGCLIINGMAHNLRGRLDKLVADGVLRKVKIGRERKPKGSVQFDPRKCLLAFELVGEDL